jgi:hypothetical protein
MLNIIKEKEERLELSKYELDNTIKSEIWCSLLGITDKKYDIYDFITEEEGKSLFILYDLYKRNISPKNMSVSIPNFSIFGFKALFFILEILKILNTWDLVQMDGQLENTIHCAMKKRFNILSKDSDVMKEDYLTDVPSEAYDVFYSLCCNRLCALNEKVRNLGNESATYDMFTRTYRCKKKKSKKKSNLKFKEIVSDIQLQSAKNIAQSEEYEQVIMNDNSLLNMDVNISSSINSDNTSYSVNKIKNPIQKGIQQILETTEEEGSSNCFKHLVLKAQKKIARTIRRQETLDCLTSPPLLTINTKGKYIIQGKSFNKKRKYLNCPKCGDFHNYKDAFWRGEQYYCSHCWTEEESYYAKCLSCQNIQIRKPDQLSSIVNGSKNLKKPKSLKRLNADDEELFLITNLLNIEDDNDPEKTNLMKENISKSFRSHTPQNNTDIITSIYQNEAKGKKDNKKITKMDYEKLSYDPEMETTSTKDSNVIIDDCITPELEDFENLSEPEEYENHDYNGLDNNDCYHHHCKPYDNLSYDININPQNTFSEKVESNNGTKRLTNNGPKKKKTKRKKMTITPSMVSAKGMNKIYINKYEEYEKSYLLREKVMSSNRKKKDKLTERMQRYIRKHGRLIYINLQQESTDSFLLKVGSLCNTHHNKHIYKQSNFINKNFKPDIFSKIGIYCQQDITAQKTSSQK